MALDPLRAAAFALVFAAPAMADPQSAPDAPPVAVRIVPATPIPAKAPEPLICRSSLETGSLVKRRKQCLTKAQWRYVDQQHETFARRIVEDGSGRPSCNDAASC